MINNEIGTTRRAVIVTIVDIVSDQPSLDALGVENMMAGCVGNFREGNNVVDLETVQANSAALIVVVSWIKVIIDGHRRGS